MVDSNISRKLHINRPELKAVVSAPVLQGHQVMIATEYQQARRDLVTSGNRLRSLADHLSRPNQPISTEWSLRHEMVKRIGEVNVHKVIQKLRSTQAAEVIPWWPKQSWFSTPTSFLCETPLSALPTIEIFCPSTEKGTHGGSHATL